MSTLLLYHMYTYILAYIRMSRYSALRVYCHLGMYLHTLILIYYTLYSILLSIYLYIYAI